jgi:membrane-bound ClpP family serine protease
LLFERYMKMPDAGALATILLVAGLFLLALELMVPSFGLLGISATVCLVISLWSAGQAWWGSQPGFFWTYLAVWLGGIPAILLGTLYLIQHTALGNHVILKTIERNSDGSNLDVQNHLHELVGQTGKTVSPLTPGGMVLVNGERHHAECVGPILDSGTVIQVVKTRATRLVVRRQTTEEATELPSVDNTPQIHVEPHPTDNPFGSDQLDFDIPDNYTARQQTPES